MYCSAHTRKHEKCSNRARYTIQDKHYCKVHGKQLTNHLEEAEADCPICMNSVPLIKSTHTSCGHDFCKTCLRKWLREHDNCPICRTVLSVTNPENRVEDLTNDRIIRFIEMDRIRINRSNQFIIELLDVDDLLFLEHWNNHTVDTSQIIYIA
jgi:hypothetical protein